MPGSPPGQPSRPISGPPIPGQPFSRHCPHCWGNCGGCLIPGVDGCIHQGPTVPWRVRWRGFRTRRFWRAVLLGRH